MTAQELQQQKKQHADARASQVVRMINRYQELVSLGFSDENWAYAAYVLTELSHVTEKRHVDTLGALMAESYTHPSFQRVQEVCGQVMLDIQHSPPPAAPLRRGRTLNAR